MHNNKKKPERGNRDQMESDHGQEQEVANRGPIYDEIYLALGVLRKLMRFLGLFPFTENVRDNSAQESVVDGLQFQWTSGWLMMTVISGIATGIFFFYGIWHEAMLVPNKMEGMVHAMFIAMVCITAWINLLEFTRKAKDWPNYFRKWKEIDTMLDISWDVELRSHSFKATIMLTLIHISLIAATCLFIAAKLIFGDISGYGFAIGMAMYATLVTGCQLLPEILFTYLCRATTVRLEHLSNKIKKLLPTLEEGSVLDPFLNVADELEKSRIIYQMLMAMIDRTNEILGIPLACSCIMNPFSLVIVVYVLSEDGMNSAGARFHEALVFFVPLLRLTAICLYAQSIQTELKRFKKVLFQIPIVQLTEDGKNEMHLFLRHVKSSKSSVSANGYILIDKGFLGQVAGTVLTYAITLLQVGQQYGE